MFHKPSSAQGLHTHKEPEPAPAAKPALGEKSKKKDPEDLPEGTATKSKLPLFVYGKQKVMGRPSDRSARGELRQGADGTDAAGHFSNQVTTLVRGQILDAAQDNVPLKGGKYVRVPLTLMDGTQAEVLEYTGSDWENLAQVPNGNWQPAEDISPKKSVASEKAPEQVSHS